MKMLRITKRVISEYFHTHTDLIEFLKKKEIALTALKYETPMFQEFRTQNKTRLIFFNLLFFSPKALLDAYVSCYSYATTRFQKQYHSY